MTPQEIEDERSRQVKCHYASLISHELNRLSEEQLFKVLVLVKNTTDEAQRRAPKPSRNRSLFDGARISNSQDVSERVKESANFVKRILTEKGLTNGYGIISMFGKSTRPFNSSSSVFVCFCVPDEIDMMVEVSPTSGDNIFILSVAPVGLTPDQTTFYNLQTLEIALDNIVKKYKK